ncbi:uncharacterized protein LOC143145788 [Ptiloglossa arizonensis]|uniref:uncharacterized protein LOC143145788 n=1 Tax=Ptiloglossa arizonensis TaxID=3350558 RepID=UPI003F9F9F1B
MTRERGLIAKSRDAYLPYKLPTGGGLFVSSNLLAQSRARQRPILAATPFVEPFWFYSSVQSSHYAYYTKDVDRWSRKLRCRQASCSNGLLADNEQRSSIEDCQNLYVPRATETRAILDLGFGGLSTSLSHRPFTKCCFQISGLGSIQHDAESKYRREEREAHERANVYMCVCERARACG